MIYLIMGKSATGKDTVLQSLLKKKELQLNRIIQYTTRPIKDGELDGREYYFVNKEKMHELEASGHILECRKYDTIYGDWYYFTTDETLDPDKNYVLIGTLPVLDSLRSRFNNVRAVYLYLDDGERLQRALDRENASENPRYAEMCRRFLNDEKDFSQEEIGKSKIDLFVENMKLDATIDKISTFIKGE